MDEIEPVNPEKMGRKAVLPPVSLLLAQAMDSRRVEEIKKRENVPVIVIFPARGDEELATLEKEIKILQPVAGRMVDETWIAFGGNDRDDIPQMAAKYGAQVFYSRKSDMNDVVPSDSGKGLAMRGILHHLCTQKGLNNPQAIIEFIDADIREEYFNPRWVIDPVGAILWFEEIEVAKIVYQRPHGGRLNALISPFLSVFDHPAINPLKKLLYFLSGEIAGTLNFWLSVPFKQSFGIEMKILTSLALNKVGLREKGADLNRVIQVFMGEMDHKHSPLRSADRMNGLDAMAKGVFQTFLEDLAEEDMVQMHKGLSFSERLQTSMIMADQANEKISRPRMLDIPACEKTLPPLKHLPEIEAACPWLVRKIQE